MTDETPTPLTRDDFAKLIYPLMKPYLDLEKSDVSFEKGMVLSHALWCLIVYLSSLNKISPLNLSGFLKSFNTFDEKVGRSHEEFYQHCREGKFYYKIFALYIHLISSSIEEKGEPALFDWKLLENAEKT